MRHFEIKNSKFSPEIILRRRWWGVGTGHPTICAYGASILTPLALYLTSPHM